MSSSPPSPLRVALVGLVTAIALLISGYLWARLAARSGSLVPGAIAHGGFNLIIGVVRGLSG